MQERYDCKIQVYMQQLTTCTDIATVQIFNSRNHQLSGE